MSMIIQYRVNMTISTEAFIDLLKRSTLANRRPVDDIDTINGMLENSNLIITAWHQEKLIGIARCITDFHYACYLSDLAVDTHHQQSGIGKELQRITQNQLGPKCKLILIAAPAANTYYEHIGFTQNPRCWVLNRDERIKG